MTMSREELIASEFFRDYVRMFSRRSVEKSADDPEFVKAFWLYLQCGCGIAG